MHQVGNHDLPGPINFDDLNIIIRPQPPRRRLSGTSIIPFRPYVKRLTSVRQEFSFANGRDKWSNTGEVEPFFNQENARCIGSLIDDCGISEVIRWDIEGESTRLPMMCKLWMIVDGAVVERGKPHMVQDAAVQVFIAGRNRASILLAEQQHYQTVTRRYDRRRRHSWHDVNEYHSIPYFQYTRSTHSGPTKYIQCDMDNEHLTSSEEYLPFISEETVIEDQLMELEEHNAHETIHEVYLVEMEEHNAQGIIQDRSQISMKAEPEPQFRTRSTSIDSGIIVTFNLNSEKNENVRDKSPNDFRDISTGTRDDFEDSHQSIATGSDTEFSNQSVSTRDYIQYANQSAATHDNIQYSDRSVATRDDIEYSDRSVATYDDVKYTTQSVSTHDDIEYLNQSVSTRDDIEYLNQSVSTRDDIEYLNQSVSTRDDIEYMNQSVSTRDDTELSYHSVATGNDVAYANQSVSTRDDIEYSHRSVATHDDIKYSNRSVATHDDIEYSDRSVATRDDIEYSHQSIATGNDVAYSNQSVSTRDDIEYSHRSVATHDDIEYSHQSVATRDDIEFLNQSVSTHDDVQYSNRSTGTGDGYPEFWLHFSTNELLSNYIIEQSEYREQALSRPSTRQNDRSIQTDTEQDTDIESPRPRPSSRSSGIAQSSSSVTISNHYEVSDQVDDEHSGRKSLPFISHRERIDSHGDLDSRSSDYQLETSSNRDYHRSRRATSSSKQSDTGYNSFKLALNQQSYSTPDPDDTLVQGYYSANETIRTIQTTKSSETPSLTLLESLSERYEKTLRARQRAIAIINDELLDIDDVLKHYREKIRDPVTTQSDRTLQLSRNITSTSYKSREERPSSPVSSTISSRIGYQFIPNVSDEDIIQDYIPSSRMYTADSFFNSPRPSQLQPNYGYCDLCLTDHTAGSAWIRYNEQRIDQLQQRMDLMLEVDESEETQVALSTLHPMRNRTTQRIDDILIGRSRRRNQISYSQDRSFLPRQSNFRLPYRFHSMTPGSSRFSSRNIKRSILLASKRVRISTNHVFIPNQTPLPEPISSSESVPRPIVSILRRNNSSLTPSSSRLIETPHMWNNDIDRNMYMLEPVTIPRYYRLYNDVGFRAIYDFSRALDSYINRISSRDYSSLIQNFALDGQLPPPMTIVA